MALIALGMLSKLMLGLPLCSTRNIDWGSVNEDYGLRSLKGEKEFLLDLGSAAEGTYV